MSYIGQQPLNNFVTKQSQTFTPDGSTVSFTLNFAVTSGIDIMLVINNVVQEPGAGKAYTASGTTLTMSEAPGASDSMYCIFLGLALQTVNPGDASVGTSKLVDSAVTNAKIANSTIDLTSKVTGTLPAGNGGTGTTSYTAGITEADMFRLTADLNSDSAPISSNLERVDDISFAKIGTGMTESSGIFSFPTTGLYFVQYSFVGECNNDGYNVYMYVTTDGTNYNLEAAAAVGGPSGYNVSSTSQTYVNVTDTSNVKVKFHTTSMAGTSATRMYGDTNLNWTTFTFIRLGDSV